METLANQPPRLKLAAPSGAAAAAAVRGKGPEWDWAAPRELPGATPRSTVSRPQSQHQKRGGTTASRCSLAPGLDGKSCGPAPSVLVGQACSSHSHGVRGAWGDTPSAPAPRGEPARLFSGAAGPPWPERLHSHCCSVLTVVWDGRRLIAQGTSVAASVEVQ